MDVAEDGVLIMETDVRAFQGAAFLEEHGSVGSSSLGGGSKKQNHGQFGNKTRAIKRENFSEGEYEEEIWNGE